MFSCKWRLHTKITSFSTLELGEHTVLASFVSFFVFTFVLLYGVFAWNIVSYRIAYMHANS